MRLLHLSTTIIKFSFLNKFCVDGVTVGSSLGPILTNIFMAELKEKIAMHIHDLGRQVMQCVFERLKAAVDQHILQLPQS